MNVKTSFTFFKELKVSHLCFGVSMVLLLLAMLSFRVPNHEYETKQDHLAVRSIGDDLLRWNGDFSTPVLPLSQSGSGSFLLRFNSPLVINPDSLATSALNHLKEHLSSRSMLTVYNEKNEVVYAMEINHHGESDIPCIGRNLPRLLYNIEVQFAKDEKSPWIVANLSSLGAAGCAMLFVMLGLLLQDKTKALSEFHHIVEWRSIKLDVENYKLIGESEKIKLTEKETQILALLIRNDGKVVSRSSFLDEIWYKQGVVTDRSLDMYISRLRKKLLSFSDITIGNQHGKGYYLKLKDT